MSATRDTAWSGQPPTHAAAMANVAPTSVEIATMSAGPRRLSRAPKISRESRSRPNESVPSQCADEIPSFPLRMLPALGLYGAIHGARTASATSPRMNRPAATATGSRSRVDWRRPRRAPSAGGGARTGAAVADISGRSRPQPRVQYQAPEVDNDVDHDERGHQDHRVPDHMPGDDALLSDAPAVRSLDVLLAEFLLDCGPGELSGVHQPRQRE